MNAFSEAVKAPVHSPSNQIPQYEASATGQRRLCSRSVEKFSNSVCVIPVTWPDVGCDATLQYVSLQHFPCALRNATLANLNFEEFARQW